MMQNRQIEMLKAAIPYTEPRLRKPMQIVIQAEELAAYMRESENEADLQACDMDSVGDLEGMMESIREYCNAAERETVDLVLNFIRVQRMYQLYRRYKKSNGNEMMEFLTSQLTAQQRKTFDQMSSFMNMEQGVI